MDKCRPIAAWEFAIYVLCHLFSHGFFSCRGVGGLGIWSARLKMHAGDARHAVTIEIFGPDLPKLKALNPESRALLSALTVRL